MKISRVIEELEYRKKYLGDVDVLDIIRQPLPKDNGNYIAFVFREIFDEIDSNHLGGMLHLDNPRNVEKEGKARAALN